MLNRYAKVFFSGLVIFDIFFILISALIAFYLRFDTFYPPLLRTLELRVYLLAIIPLIFTFLVGSKFSGLYKPLRGSFLRVKLITCVKTAVFILVVITSTAFFYRDFSFSRLVLIYFWFIFTLYLLLSRILVYKFFLAMRNRGFNQRNVLIFGDLELGQMVALKLIEHVEFGMNVVGFLTQHHEKVGGRINGVKILGVYADINKIVSEYKIDKLYVTLQNHELHSLGISLDSLGLIENIDLKVVLDFPKHINFGAGLEDLDGMFVFRLKGNPVFGWDALVKRLLDIIGAILAIAVSTPLLLLLGVLIKLESRGPIIYRQRRVGRNGKEFVMFKFRSMHVDAEKETGVVWADKNDDRRTKLGKILRENSLDELPQLFNVLFGDMSLVGPRPERPELIKSFKGLKAYGLRIKLKPGLSGWAQVNGWRGNSSIEKRLEFDLYYGNHWSIWFDLKIIFMTIFKGFRHPNAH